jgi:RNA polymerase sigma-70 factor (ECF subfamily)
MSAPKTAPHDSAAETDLIARAIRRDEAAIRAIVAQHNRRLFRLARGILRDDGEAEDALQNAYFKAFTALAGFRGEARLTTWLSRIVMNECFQRLRGARAEIPATIAYEPAIEAQIIPFPQSAMQLHDPEKTIAQRELLHLVETAVDALPDDFRLVLVARTIEGMSVEETAELLGIRAETVKTRLFRARQLLRAALDQHVDPLLTGAFPFFGLRCKHMADTVVARLAIN